MLLNHLGLLIIIKYFINERNKLYVVIFALKKL